MEILKYSNKKVSLILGLVIGLSFLPHFIFTYNFSDIDPYQSKFREWVVGMIGYRLSLSSAILILLGLYLYQKRQLKFPKNHLFLTISIPFLLFLSTIWSVDKPNTIINFISFLISFLIIISYRDNFNKNFLFIGFLVGIIPHFIVPFNYTFWLIGLTQNRSVFAGLIIIGALLLLYSQSPINKLNSLKIKILFILSSIPALTILTSSRTGILAATLFICILTYFIAKYQIKPALAFLSLTIILASISFNILASEQNKGHITSIFIEGSTSGTLERLETIKNYSSPSYKNPNNSYTYIPKSPIKPHHKILGAGFHNTLYINPALIHTVPLTIYSEIGVLTFIFYLILLYILIKVSLTFKIILIIITFISLADPYLYRGTFATTILFPIFLGLAIHDIKRATQQRIKYLADAPS